MKKVLIADDSASIRESLSGILAPLADCHIATNGREAVNLIKMTQAIEKGFDIVMMDIIMPEKDGLTAVKEIREYEAMMGWSEDEVLTIILITTLAEPSRILIAQKECGANGYIAKPFTRNAVLQILKDHDQLRSGHHGAISRLLH